MRNSLTSARAVPQSTAIINAATIAFQFLIAPSPAFYLESFWVPSS
jgi:hypothetical protein